jgi:hypothetical protein
MYVVSIFALAEVQDTTSADYTAVLLIGLSSDVLAGVLAEVTGGACKSLQKC